MAFRAGFGTLISGAAIRWSIHYPVFQGDAKAQWFLAHPTGTPTGPIGELEPMQAELVVFDHGKRMVFNSSQTDYTYFVSVRNLGPDSAAYTLDGGAVV
jgi:hypothetical protein